jgi:protein-tyrosine phosphatase
MPSNRPIVSPDGHVLRTPAPDRIATQVYPGVWLGGSFTRYPRAEYPIFDVDLEVCHPGDGFRPRTRQLISAGFDDGPTVPENLPELVTIVTDAVARRQPVIVRSYAGLNRSALVVAVVLCVITTECARDVVDALRIARSDHVLCNPAFETHLLEKYPR